MNARTENNFLKSLTIIFFFMQTLYAEAFPFINISTREGLSNRHVSSMTVDDKGYYWFATHSGIDKFNGRDFYHYTLVDNKEEVQPGGILRSDDNSILAYSQHSVFRYSQSSDSFECLDRLRIPETCRITSVKEDNKGRIWVGTSKGLFIFDKNVNLLSRLFEKLVIYDIAYYNESASFVGTSKGLRKVVHPVGAPISSSTLQESGLAGERVQSLFCDIQTKNIWIGTFNGSLYVYNIASGGKEEIVRQFKRPIRKIVPIDTDCIWTGVDGEGIYVFNRYTLAATEEFTPSGNATHLYSGSNGVYDIYQDDDLVWICTYSNGILVFDRTMLVSGIFTERNIDVKHSGDSQVNCLYQDVRGRIWFGTNNGIMRYNPVNKEWKHFISPQTGNGTVLALKEDGNGNMWAGGFMFDVMYIDPSDNIVVPALKDSSKAFPRNVYSINEDKQGNMYFGGIINGMVRYNPKENTLVSYPVRGIYQIMSLPDGNFLIATTNGIVRFNTLDLKIESKGNIFNKSILRGSITRLCLDPADNNQLWIGTESKGLVSLNLKTGDMRHFTTADGLSNMTVCGLEFDKNHRLWVSTETGLNCISSQGNISALAKADGVPHSTMKARSHFMLCSGEIIWGTTDGAFILDPDEFVGNKKKLNLHFEKFMLAGNEVVPGVKNSPIVSIIDNVETLSLANNQNNFSITFCNVGFQNESAFKYSYMLEGFDKDWSADSYSGMAHYTNIPPGKYIFRVRAKDSTDPANSEERSIVVRIAQPWYNTPLAWCCYFVVLIVALYVSYRLYKRWMSVRDSDQKVRFFVNLAHDLRTPLTLIKAPLQDIDDVELSSDDRLALNLARKNADKLLNMVNQLLDFQKIERDAMSLKVEDSDIGRFLNELACNFIPLAQAKKINLKISGCDATGFIDKKKITVIVDNLLSNAIKYTESSGNIAFEWRIEKGILIIKVTDDGIGISAEDQKKLFNRFYRAENASNSNETGSGIGLLLTKKMANLHKGTISVNSEIGVGTSFVVNVPVLKNKYSANEILIDNNHTIDNKDINNIADDVSDSRLSLMLVEDNDELRQYLEHTLGKNYAVSAFANGDAALEKIKSIMPDFVLSDIMMPGISGLELCEKIKGDIETSHIPVILLTSLAEREDVIKGFNAGADDYITKPFDIFILNKKIASIIKARKSLNNKIIDNTDGEADVTASVISELDKEFMHNVVNVITDNLDNDEFSVNDLAAEMAMSRSVFFKKIKAITQQNPQELIRAIKMKKAADLILENRYSIAEISYMTGFPNPKYFSTAFKKFYGISPSKYAEDH